MLTTKIQPIDRDLIIRLTGTPQERSAMHAQFAREQLAIVEEQDRQATGVVPTHVTYVDGSAGASEDMVKPVDGVIVYEFDLYTDMLAWISDQLEMHSPVGGTGDRHPGLYRNSHVMLANGSEADPQHPPVADQYIFVNSQPYARKIEMGSSQQFPDGVYEAVAAMARSRYSGEAKISFEYHSIEGGALGAWANSASGRAFARARSHRRESLHHEWLTRQPAIVVTPK